MFSWSHFGFSNPAANFNTVEGTLTYDPAHPSEASVQVRMPVSSIDTHVPALDARLAAPDFFDAKKYPEITFRSTKVVPEGRYRLKALLVWRGQTYPWSATASTCASRWRHWTRLPVRTGAAGISPAREKWRWPARRAPAPHAGRRWRRRAVDPVLRIATPASSRPFACRPAQSRVLPCLYLLPLQRRRLSAPADTGVCPCMGVTLPPLRCPCVDFAELRRAGQCGY